MAFSICIQQKIPELIPLLPCGSSSKEFYEDMTLPRHLLKRTCEKIADNLFALGLMSPAELSATLTSIMGSKIGHISKVFTFKRIQMNRNVIYSKAYGNVVQRNSCTVFVDNAGFLEVNFFVKVYVQCPNVLFCSNECTCKVPVYYGVDDCLLKLAADITLSCDLFTNCKVGHIPARRERSAVVISSDHC